MAMQTDGTSTVTQQANDLFNPFYTLFNSILTYQHVNEYPAAFNL